MKTQDDSSASAHRNLVLLAPTASNLPPNFQNVHVDPAIHGSYLAQMQRLRGMLYLEDGAISEDDLQDGLHKSAADEKSWHVLTVGEHGIVNGCARFLRHDESVSYRDLTVVHSALAQSDTWGHLLQKALEEEIEEAKRRQLSYVELGGWALAHEIRNTRASLMVALATFGLSELIGGALAVSTSTIRHSSAAMMRKFGGRSLEVGGVELPAYYDPQYKCQMEILRYDSAQPNPRFAEMMQEVTTNIVNLPVICPTRLPRAIADAAERPISTPAGINPMNGLATLHIQ